MLNKVRAAVIGPFSDVERAREVASIEAIDLAVLDTNLNGEPVYPCAEELLRRGYSEDDVAKILGGNTLRTLSPPAALLHLAAQYDHVEIMTALLDSGFDVNVNHTLSLPSTTTAVSKSFTFESRGAKFG